MACPDNKGTLPSGAVINFLAKTLPFSELNAMGRKRIAESCLVKFFPKGTVILEQDVTQVTYLYLIQKGAVKIYRINEDESITPMDYCGEGATFGTFAIMSGVGNNVTVEATEDTVCMLLDRTTLLEVLQENPTIARDYFGGFCKGLVVRAYSELRRDRVGLTAEDPFYLFSAGVGETVKGPPRIYRFSSQLHSCFKLFRYSGADKAHTCIRQDNIPVRGC